MFSAIPTIGFAILIVLLAASFLIERFFCRFLCPLGALFAPVSRGRFFRIHRNGSKCNGCQYCSRSCAMGIAIHAHEHVRSGECIDCMRCTEVCAPEALYANPHPAIAGTASALVLCGTLGISRMIPVRSLTADSAAVILESAGSVAYPDGVYTGSGTGFRGEITSQVTVQDGAIVDITVLSHRDDSDYFARAQAGVITAALSRQTPEVDAVSGATFSSYGIMESVADALSLTEIKAAVAEQAQSSDQDGHHKAERSESESFTLQPEDRPEGSGRSRGEKGSKEGADMHPGHGAENGGDRGRTRASKGKRSGKGYGGEEAEGSKKPQGQNGTQKDGTLTIVPDTLPAEPVETPEDEQISLQDGVYTGKGTGYRGETEVSVTVTDGRISDITILSYADDRQYFSRAEDQIIGAILQKQSLKISTVSGATFSSNGILEAVADALDLSFINPNASAKGRGRH